MDSLSELAKPLLLPQKGVTWRNSPSCTPHNWFYYLAPHSKVKAKKLEAELEAKAAELAEEEKRERRNRPIQVKTFEC